jgi:hypothetical protein
MKKILMLTGLSVFLFAGQYQGYGKYDSESGTYNKDKRSSAERGFEKAGDSNWNNMQIDKQRYGEKNNYQGSRPGDSDWGERNLKQSMDK